MKRIFAFVALAGLGLSGFAQNYEAGEKTFKMNCASCHKMDAKLIGPPLMDVVSNQGEEWAKKWISNNETLRKSGDTHANAIYAEYNNMVMPNYSYLSDEELTDLVGYLADWKSEQNKVSAEATPAAANTSAETSAPSETTVSSAAKIILFVSLAAFILTCVTMYTLLQAFKTIVEYKTSGSNRD